VAAEAAITGAITIGDKAETGIKSDNAKSCMTIYQNLMKKIFWLLVFIFIVNNVQAQDKIDVGSKFLNFVIEKQWDDAQNLFDVSVRDKVPVALLKQIFLKLQTQVGELKLFDKPAILNYSNIYIGHFTNATLNIEINVNDSSKIVGFFFLPVSKSYKLPDYADEAKYKTEKVTIITNGVNLPGIITTPVQSQRSIPMVIFVGGSGPSDMDESIGAEKPFKDLSIGLALNGIASLRYDKRTYVYHNLPSNITLKEEYLEDLVNAIKLAKTAPGVDSNKIFIVGHSLGGMISPLILKQNPSLSGAILLEANARPIEDLIYEQYLHLSKINNNQPDSDGLKKLYIATRAIKNITIKDTSQTFLNVKGSYWYFLNSYHPIQVAKSIKHRKILIIQGGNDYQVTKTDFDLWSHALSKKQNVNFKFYPLLNHALDEGKGSLSPAEYLEPLNTPIYLANDIAAWIKSSDK
jgi:dienelactone hydrolase